MSQVAKLRRHDAYLRKKTPLIYKGVNLQKEADRYCEALGFKTTVDLTVRHGCKFKVVTGHQFFSETTITIGYKAKLASVLETLLHEICHFATWEEKRPHSEKFIACLVEAASAIWGFPVEGWQDIPKGLRQCRAYAVDDFLEAYLQEALESGFYVPTLEPPYARLLKANSGILIPVRRSHEQEQ